MKQALTPRELREILSRYDDKRRAAAEYSVAAVWGASATTGPGMDSIEALYHEKIFMCSLFSLLNLSSYCSKDHKDACKFFHIDLVECWDCITFVLEKLTYDIAAIA